MASCDIKVSIRSDVDIVFARQKGRELATSMGFTQADLALIATAISELARNIVLYAGEGEIAIRELDDGNKKGIVVVARDGGPGIPDIDQALQEGYSTSRSLGLGLPGVKRIMDDFHIVSEMGRGTTVTIKRWRV